MLTNRCRLDTEARHGLAYSMMHRQGLNVGLWKCHLQSWHTTPTMPTGIFKTNIPLEKNVCEKKNRSFLAVSH